MKILLVNKFHYRKGGSETYYFALADALRRAGQEVIFFSMQDEKNELCAQEKYFVSHVEYNGPQSAAQQLKGAATLIYSNEAKRKFAALLDAEKPDIVHLNLVHRQITLSVVDACKQRGVPVVFTQHDLICVCPSYNCLSPQGVCEACLGGSFVPCIKKKCVKHSGAKSLLAAAEARFYRLHGSYQKINCYLAPSAFYKTLLEKGGFTRAPILHLPNFLPSDARSTPVAAPEGWVLYLGRLTAEKGVHTLLHAAAACPNLHFHIAGDGPERARLEALAGQQSLQNVTFCGFLQGEALQKEKEGCRALVLPSECYENAPYSVMEAMAAGKPVVGSRIGGIPELVRAGETGWTFAPGDANALAAALCEMQALPEEKYKSMCKQCAAFARDAFSEQRHIETLLAIYSRLIKGETLHG